MWEPYFEWCAEIFGSAARSKLGQLVVFALAMFAVGLFFSMRFGLAGFALPAFIVAASSLAARRVSAARDELWRSACARSDDKAPLRRGAIPPTAASLYALADAVAALRRGQVVDAEAHLANVDSSRLRPSEFVLLYVVHRALAAERAAEAGVAPRDIGIGRTLVAEAWNNPTLLALLERAMDRAAAPAAPFGKLHGLVRIRLDARRIADLPPAEARELSDEARAIGHEELAEELDARSRASAYR